MMWKPFVAPVLAAVALGVAIPVAVAGASSPVVAGMGDAAFLEVESANASELVDDDAAEEASADEVALVEDMDAVDDEIEAEMAADDADVDVEEGVVEAGQKNKDKAKEKRERPTFPMAAAAFQRHIENKLVHGRERLVTLLRAHQVSATDQTEILRMYDASAQQVRDKVARAGADGQVTKEEAAEVRKEMKDLRQGIRRKLAAEKAEGAKEDRAKAKNNGKSKDRQPKRPARV